MIYRPGIQAQRIVDSIRKDIVSGALPIGAKLPAHKILARSYGVAPLTVRHALSLLEGDGLISREQGRGTFVRATTKATVLIVDDDSSVREALAKFVGDQRYEAVQANGPKQAWEYLHSGARVSLILSDVRMPDAKDGIGFIRQVRQQYPQLPLAALTGFTDDLAPLLGTPECPILILAKPIQPSHINSLLEMALK